MEVVEEEVAEGARGEGKAEEEREAADRDAGPCSPG